MQKSNLSGRRNGSGHGNGMKTDIKTVCVVLIMSLLLGLCGCVRMLDPDADRIIRIYFLSATGTRTGTNSFTLDEGWITSGNAKAALRSDDALALIQKVKALPDCEEDRTDLAYIIELDYMEKGVADHVKKCGYGSFPDNWEEIVGLVNKSTANYKTVSDSRELVVIDGRLLQKYCSRIAEDDLPSGVTFNDVVREMPVTYKTMCDYGWDGNKILDEYLYGYYGLAVNQMKELDEHPEPSTYEELKTFVANKLVDVYWENDSTRCLAGSYNGCSYWVIRYDEFQKWYDEEDAYGKNNFHRQLTPRDHGLEYIVDDYNGPEGAYSLLQYRYVYVDSSGKFIVMTNSKNYKDIYDVLN